MGITLNFIPTAHYTNLNKVNFIPQVSLGFAPKLQGHEPRVLLLHYKTFYQLVGFEPTLLVPKTSVLTKLNYSLPYIGLEPILSKEIGFKPIVSTIPPIEHIIQN